MFVLTIVSHIFGMVVIFGGLVVASIFTLSKTNPYNYLNIAMLAAGVLTFTVCLVYFILLNGQMNVRTNVRPGGLRSQQRVVSSVARRPPVSTRDLHVSPTTDTPVYLVNFQTNNSSSNLLF